MQKRKSSSPYPEIRIVYIYSSVHWIIGHSEGTKTAAMVITKFLFAS